MADARDPSYACPICGVGTPHDHPEVTVGRLREHKIRCLLQAAIREIEQHDRGTTHWAGCEERHVLCRISRLVSRALEIA